MGVWLVCVGIWFNMFLYIDDIIHYLICVYIRFNIYIYIIIIMSCR